MLFIHTTQVKTNYSCSASWVWTGYARLKYFHHVTLHNSETYIIFTINYAISQHYNQQNKFNRRISDTNNRKSNTKNKLNKQ